MVRVRLTRTLVLGLVAGVAGMGAVVAQAVPYVGVHVKGKTFRAGPHAADVQLRVVCPPGTQSTPRPGDFSFCTGDMVITHGGTVVARGPFSIRTFDSHLEHFPTVGPGRRLFKKGRRVTVHWEARNHDGQGNFRSNSGNVVVVQ